MPAFFSKVFARGREKEKEKGKDGLKEPSSPTTKQARRTSRTSAQSLLEGKFEAVSPSVSPTAEKYEEKAQTPKKDKEKERIGLLRPKSRTSSANDASQKQENVPQLKLDLNLPSIKDGSKNRNLSIVYEGDTVLDEAVLGEKRLNPAEALKLMHACSTVLSSRGLETLGVMHPHWHSASPAAQRRIISLFISSLAASSEASAASSTFDSELEYARSPHDVAAVFRWALRHLKLEDDAFDKDNTASLAWYESFMEKEKAADYPKTAYSDLLLPIVKPSHAELLDSTLSLVSRLASHSDWNGTSGSKLSMFFGYYLLTGNRVENPEDWLQFYSQWERTGRALEHIFLASLRDEEAKTGIPKRLSELVVNYPYSKSVTDNQFPRPTRFATRPYDALYIRVSAESQPGNRPRQEVYLPLQLVENALKSEIGDALDDKELVALWEDVRKLCSVSDEKEGTTEKKTAEKSLASVFSDESIRMLSLKSDSSDKGTPIISMFAPVPEHDNLFGTPTANGRAKVANGSTSVSRQTSDATTSSPIASDWNFFSSAGFGESAAGQSLAATLLDSDVEKTEPPKLTPRRSLKKSRSPGRASRADKAAEQSSLPVRFKTSRVSLVKIDETFIEFWNDALLDPISDAWPNFVVCQLKSDAVHTYGDKKVAWLVIEQKFVVPAPSPAPSPARRASSPRPSVRSDGEKSGKAGRANATFSPRKRFNFFSSQSPVPSTVSGSEKRGSKSFAKGTKVNELGEIVPEEKVAASPPVAKADKAKAPESKVPPVPEKSKQEMSKEAAKKPDDVAVGAAIAVGAGALAATAEAAADTLAPEAEKPKAPAQDEALKETAKEEAPEVPVKEAEPEPAVAAAEEPIIAPPVKQEPADETSQVEEAAEAIPPQPEGTHNEVKAEEPAALAPEMPTIDTESSVPAAPLQVAEEKAAEPAASTEVPSEETEDTAAGAHQGAGDSRFVEHIENTPPGSAALEPAPEHPESRVDVEPAGIVSPVPETIPEEPSEEPAAPAETTGLADVDAAPTTEEHAEESPGTVEAEPEVPVAVEEPAVSPGEPNEEVTGANSKAAEDVLKPHPEMPSGAPAPGEDKANDKIEEAPKPAPEEAAS